MRDIITMLIILTGYWLLYMAITTFWPSLGAVPNGT
jgi:hypothetical protein